MLKAHFPVTTILDPFFNSMSPLNITLATHEEFQVSYDDALKLQLLQFLISMDGAVVLISSLSVLFNMRGPSEEKRKRIFKRQHRVIVSFEINDTLKRPIIDQNTHGQYLLSNFSHSLNNRRYSGRFWCIARDTLEDKVSFPSSRVSASHALR